MYIIREKVLKDIYLPIRYISSAERKSNKFNRKSIYQLGMSLQQGEIYTENLFTYLVCIFSRDKVLQEIYLPIRYVSSTEIKSYRKYIYLLGIYLQQRESLTGNLCIY